MTSTTAQPSPVESAETLQVANLAVTFTANRRRDSHVVVVNGVTFAIERGEKVGLVGESGSGKTATALSVTRLIDHLGGGIAPTSSVRVTGTEVVGSPRRVLRELRAHRVGMIFQDSLTSLNPTLTVGYQLAETIAVGEPGLDRRTRRARAVALLDTVRIARPAERVNSYPHELSGGMRQRVMIAMALAANPELLIADEPTTALDVIVQAEIFALLREIVSDRGMSILLITHDLALVSQFTDRLVIMYAGRIVEAGDTSAVLERPMHPYTAGLLSSIPDLHRDRSLPLQTISGSPPFADALPTGCAFHPRCSLNDGTRCVSDTPPLREIESSVGRASACHHVERLRDAEVSAPGVRSASTDGGDIAPSAPAGGPLLSVRNLHKDYKLPRRSPLRASEFVRAVDDASFEIARGEALGLVGESGSGKSTTARCVAGLVTPTKGTIVFDDCDVVNAGARTLRRMRRKLQMVFQDPHSSLDGRLKVQDILSEPLQIHGLWGQPGFDVGFLSEVLRTVGLPDSALSRYPHQFSGGQRQRIAVARALTLRPELIIFDEPVSSLDVSISAGIVNMLNRLRAQFSLSYLFIAHDLSVVRQVCDRIIVMKDGQIVEQASNESFFNGPVHPYSRALLEAHPRLLRSTDGAAGEGIRQNAR